MKKILILVVIMTFFITGCTKSNSTTGKTEGTTTTASQPEEIVFTAVDIATFGEMVTPGDDANGSVTYEQDGDVTYAKIITNGIDEWGGVETPVFDLDVKKTPTLQIDIYNVLDCNDSSNTQCLWGVKLVVDGDRDLAPWGQYIFVDNSNTGLQTVNLDEILNGEDNSFTDAFGDGKIKVKLWIFPAKGANCSVGVKSITIKQ